MRVTALAVPGTPAETERPRAKIHAADIFPDVIFNVILAASRAIIHRCAYEKYVSV
jgi:hypothetical protein